VRKFHGGFKAIFDRTEKPKAESLSAELLNGLYKAAERKLGSQERELKIAEKLELLFGKHKHNKHMHGAEQEADAQEGDGVDEGEKPTVKDFLATN